MGRKIFLLILLILFLSPAMLFAQDVEESQDHPLISRFPGARIVYYHEVSYDQFPLGLGKWDHREKVFEESKVVEGSGTNILYYISEEHSPLEIFKSYENALTGSDFEIIFSGKDEELGRYGEAMDSITCFHSGFSSTRRGDISHHVSGASNPHYLSAKKTIENKETYITVFVGGASIHRSHPLALVRIIEKQKLQDDLISVNRAWERKEIERLSFDREDPEGSRDHPLISRFPGAVITYFAELEHDRYELGLGMWDRNAKEFEESKTLEGRVTRIKYFIPPDRTPLEIYRNYEAALNRADFEILFSGAGDELGRYGEAMYKERYFQGGVASWINRGHIGHHLGGAGDQHYLAGKLSIRGQDVYIGIFIGGGSIHSPNPLVLLNIVEQQTMVEDLISAGDLKEQIEMTGKALVYGIYFDTNCSEVKPESDPMLEEIALLLEETPDLSLYIVGHTDDQGSFDYNMTLSKQRANSVVDKLVQEFGVNPNRLQPVGVGPAAPESTNETEAGRASNRRVELVKKLN